MKLYIDMDGVLVDFVGGYLKYNNIDSKFILNNWPKNEYKIKKYVDIKNDLKQNYGIENISPIKGVPNRDPKSETVEGVYKEIKQMGSYAKEQMQQRYDLTNKEQKEKGIKWRKDKLALAAKNKKHK